MKEIRSAKKYLMEKLTSIEDGIVILSKEPESKLRKVPMHSYKSSTNNNRITTDTADN